MFVPGTQFRAAIDFWSSSSLYQIPEVTALMVSFGEIHNRAHLLRGSCREGLGQHLGFPGQVFLDNGSFALPQRRIGHRIEEYVGYVRRAKPDWYPVPIDYIPSPSLGAAAARRLADKTATINDTYAPRGFVPVVHVGPSFHRLFEGVLRRRWPPRIAIGGIVPHLRPAKGANLRSAIAALAKARKEYPGHIHVFGLGGSAFSLCLAYALGADSVDSSGWRVRAAAGLILLPRRGERMVAKVSSWTARELSGKEERILARCQCPACGQHGAKGLRLEGRDGFVRRGVHNLWTLAKEVRALNALARRSSAVDFLREASIPGRFREAVEYAVVAVASA
jgi:7-cyano-7-deazaguanine tRNA-ribosyltransferase